MRTISRAVALGACLLASPLVAGASFEEVREVDVSTHSFTIIVRTAVASDVTLELFADVGATQPVVATVLADFNESGDAALAQAASDLGMNRLRVQGLSLDSAYFYRLTITPEAGGAAIVLPASGPLPSVRTALGNRAVNNATVLGSVLTDQSVAASGSVLLLSHPGGDGQISHTVGDGFAPDEALVSLNNLFDAASRENAALAGGVTLDAAADGGLEGNATGSATLAACTPNGVPWELPFSPMLLTQIVDSDGDGMPDDFESRYGLDNASDDSGDDADGDGLTNLEEYQLGTNPQSTDSDGDSLSDGDEVNVHGTLATESDTDQDGLSDGEEINTYATDAVDADSDDDGVDDGTEIELGGDPNDNGSVPVIDTDNDGTGDAADNCPLRPNPDQLDTDGDGDGDVCDDDDDNDGVPDSDDNAPLIANADQTDTDADGIGDVADNCQTLANSAQLDNDSDGMGDVCDADDDNDGVDDFEPLPAPSDLGLIVTRLDALVTTSLAANVNPNAVLTVYKFDTVGDTLLPLGQLNLQTGALSIETPDPISAATQGALAFGYDSFACDCLEFDAASTITLATDAGDVTAWLPASETLNAGTVLIVAEDGSTYLSYFPDSLPLRLSSLRQAQQNEVPLDNCQFVANADQLDTDGDGIGDVCDQTADDLDGDSIANADDNCPNDHNVAQLDLDGDGLGDVCDSDADGDGLDNLFEMATLGTNPLAADTNGDGVSDAFEDSDFDGMNNSDEIAAGRQSTLPETSLAVGLNIVYHLPAVPAGLTSFQFLADLGGPGVVDSISRVQADTDVLETARYDAGVPSGSDFAIATGEAYLVTMLQERLHTWGAAVECGARFLAAGTNAAGLGCVPRGSTAAQILADASALKAIRGIDPQSGNYTAAGNFAGQAVGEDFTVDGSRGYLLHVDQPATLGLFDLQPPVVGFDGGLVDGAIVSTSQLDLSGFINSPGAYVLINGIAAAVETSETATSFSLSGIALVEGVNALVIRVLAANGLITEQTINITYAVPPDLVITSHTDGQILPSATTVIEGTVSDAAANVTINGSPVVQNGNDFSLADVALSDGDNILEVIATGSNGGVAQQTITLTSTPLEYVLATPNTNPFFPPPYYDRVTADFELFLPESVFNVATQYRTVDNSPSFIDYTAGSVTVMPPQTWQYDFDLRITSSSRSNLGQHDFTVTYEILDAQDQLIRTDEIRFRVFIAGRQPFIVYADAYDLSTVSTDSITISGYVLGALTSLSIGGQTVDTTGFGSQVQSRTPFQVDVPLVPGENFVDVIADNFFGNETTELLIIYDPAGPLEVGITSPRARQVVSADSVLVEGTVNNAAASVLVNGVAAPTVPDGLGGATFSANVDLIEGNNDILAYAQIGEFIAAKSIRLVKGAFDFTIDRYDDGGISNVRYPIFSGSASVPLQQVTMSTVGDFGVATVTGNTWAVNPQAGQGILLVDQPGPQRVDFVATAMTGETVETSLLLNYEPVRLTYPYIYKGPATIEWDSGIPDTLVDDIASWRYRFEGSADASPTWVMWNPVLGRVIPTTFEHLGNGRLRIDFDHELHGSTPIGVHKIQGQAISFYDADGAFLYRENLDIEWDLQDSSNQEIFITSYSDGDVVRHWVGEVFGVMGNVNAQEVRINGEVVQFDDDEFWDDEPMSWPDAPFFFTGVPLSDGPNLITVEVDTVEGATLTDSVTVISEPARVSLRFGQTRNIAMRLHQREPDNFSVNMFPDDFVGDYLRFNNPGSFSTTENPDYRREDDEPMYRLHTYVPSVTFDSQIPGGTDDYGLWVFSIRLNGNEGRRNQMGVWINLLESSTVVPDVQMTSHSDGETVAVGPLAVSFQVPGDGFAELTVNGQTPSIAYPMQPDDCVTPLVCQHGTRIFPIYTATIDIAAGTNTITVDATSSTDDSIQVQFTLNGSP